MDREKLLAEVKKRDVKLLRFIFVDTDGVIRGFSSYRDELRADLESGHGMTKAILDFTVLDTLVPDGKYGPVGEVRLIPDLRTFKVLPYAQGTASVICDLRTLDDRPFEACSRSALKAVLGDVEPTVKASFENEFFLLQRDASGKLVPVDRDLCFSTTGMNTNNTVMLAIIDALQAQGLHVEKYYHEYAPGQQELSYRYDTALNTADNQVTFRETVRGVAQNQGLVASFMPKISEALPGSGCHTHVSLWKGQTNLFYDEGDKFHLSDMGYHFIGGLLQHARSLVAFTASHVISYKRLVPFTWSGAIAAYGYDNRECAVRIPSHEKGREQETVRLEFKPVDAACNPYLALGAIISAGMDGVRRKLDPGDPVDVNPGSLSPAEMDKRGIFPLPESLGEALRELQQDPIYPKAFGTTLVEEYIKVKRHDWVQYLRHVSDWELEKYLQAF